MAFAWKTAGYTQVNFLFSGSHLIHGPLFRLGSEAQFSLALLLTLTLLLTHSLIVTSYLRYLEICSKTLRSCVKADLQAAAERRSESTLKFANWENGKQGDISKYAELVKKPRLVEGVNSVRSYASLHLNLHTCPCRNGRLYICQY